MRRALGLRSGGGAPLPQQRPEQARPKHRFARDGEVPVVMLHNRREHGREQDGASPSRERIVALEASLASERAARGAAERALADSQAQAQALRTQLVHAEIAHREALAAAEARRHELEQALEEAMAARTRAEAALSEPPAPQAPPEPRPESGPDSGPGSGPPGPAADTAATDEPAPARRGRRSGISLVSKRKAPRSAEPKPVKWWLPNFRNPAER